MIAGALGVRRCMGAARATSWGPMLLAGYGLGVALAGLFSADPAFGFPPGTQDVPSTRRRRRIWVMDWANEFARRDRHHAIATRRGTVLMCGSADSS